MNPVGGLGWGMLAGAAGATALNFVTYVDQAVRARPASNTPSRRSRPWATQSVSTFREIPGSVPTD